jgi:hypothetical protein
MMARTSTFPLIFVLCSPGHRDCFEGGGFFSVQNAKYRKRVAGVFSARSSILGAGKVGVLSTLANSSEMVPRVQRAFDSRRHKHTQYVEQ